MIAPEGIQELVCQHEFDHEPDYIVTAGAELVAKVEPGFRELAHMMAAAPRMAETLHNQLLARQNELVIMKLSDELGGPREASVRAHIAQLESILREVGYKDDPRT